MKVILGLGNPGKQYQETRHNVGARFVRAFAGDLEWKENKTAQALLAEDLTNKWLFALPQTFMNRSGETLKYLKKKHPKLESDHLFVVHDDLDIPIGEYKVQFAKGPHDHNGLFSLYQAWGSTQFWHIRIGIDGRAGMRSISGQEYVLQPLSPDERVLFEQMSLRLTPELHMVVKQ